MRIQDITEVCFDLQQLVCLLLALGLQLVDNDLTLPEGRGPGPHLEARVAPSEGLLQTTTTALSVRQIMATVVGMQGSTQWNY